MEYSGWNYEKYSALFNPYTALERNRARIVYSKENRGIFNGRIWFGVFVGLRRPLYLFHPIKQIMRIIQAYKEKSQNWRYLQERII
jgi:hypothetical protein